MKVQNVRMPNSNKKSWIVIGDNFLPILPISEFIKYMENIEYSPNTIRSYAYHLKLYWEYLRAAKLEWSKVGLSEIADFVSWLRNPQLGVELIYEQQSKRSESTINVILTCVSMFYEFHGRNNTSIQNLSINHYQNTPHKYKGLLYHINKGKPVKSTMIKLKAPKKIPKTLTQEQILHIINACNCIRDKFLVSLVYETGMRIGQALGLRHEDIHSWDNTIYIVPRDENINNARSKSKEQNIIHVSKELMTLYTDYIVHEFGETDSDYVFVNLWKGNIGEPMRYETAVDIFNRLSKKIGIPIHWHMLRHTHATELLRSGWDAAYVQKRLGHKSIQTTINTYTHLTDEDMKEAYKKYSDNIKR